MRGAIPQRDLVHHAISVSNALTSSCHGHLHRLVLGSPTWVTTTGQQT